MQALAYILILQGDNQIWTGDQGVAVPCLTTWLCHQNINLLRKLSLEGCFATFGLLNPFYIRKLSKKACIIKCALAHLMIDDSDGNWTRVTAVKGRCLNLLTTEP